jgi:hypothetical protein
MGMIITMKMTIKMTMMMMPMKTINDEDEMTSGDENKYETKMMTMRMILQWQS